MLSDQSSTANGRIWAPIPLDPDVFRERDQATAGQLLEPILDGDPCYRRFPLILS